MNKKIYYNTKYILLTDESIQPSANQLIVNTDNESKEKISDYITKFIQQSDSPDLILQTKNVHYLFQTICKEFVFIEAAGGLIKQNDKYLFIYRLDKWDLPKGKLDDGEKPKEAAIRECEEECNISGLTILQELPSSYHIYPYKGRFALKITYWYLMDSSFKGKLTPQTEENIEKVEWLDSKAIETLVKPNTYPSILDLIHQTINN